jgi:hypothetical protein
MRPRRHRSSTIPVVVLLGLFACIAAPGCALCDLWDAQRDQKIVTLPTDAHDEPRPLVEREFVNNITGLLLTPFALVFDIVTFPVQVWCGYRPYGQRRYGDDK